jgi:hypothetical protein
MYLLLREYTILYMVILRSDMEAIGTKDARKIRHVFERSQGESNGVFILTEFQVSTRNLKISATLKPCDMSDLLEPTFRAILVRIATTTSSRSLVVLSLHSSKIIPRKMPPNDPSTGDVIDD